MLLCHDQARTGGQGDTGHGCFQLVACTRTCSSGHLGMGVSQGCVLVVGGEWGVVGLCVLTRVRWRSRCDMAWHATAA